MMIAAPWYLLSIGIVLVIVGVILGALFGVGRSPGPGIDPRLSDAEIAKRLRSQSSLGVPGLIFYAGLLCMFVSAGWRLLRFFH